MGINKSLKFKIQNSKFKDRKSLCFILCTLFLILGTFSFAQQNQQVHKVKRGETLYSISKQYDVTVDEITKANPQIEKGLKTGIELVIPKQNASAPDTVGKKYVHHKVVDGETLYALSKKYNMSLQTLLQENPDIIDGMKAGQILNIPVVKGNEAAEKMYEEEQLRKAGLLPEKEKFDSDKVFHVAFFLPLYLDENFSNSDSSDLSTFNMYQQTLPALEFYEGFLMAADSLKNTGLNFSVSVFDTRNDTNRIKIILAKPELQKTDLIAGSFQNSELAPVLKFSSENKIPVAVPSSVSQNWLTGYPEISSTSASVKTQCEEMAKFISKKFKNDNVVFVTSGLQKEKDIVSYFKNGFGSSASSAEFSYPKQLTSEIKNSFSKTKKNVIIVCSSGESNVNNFLSSLNSLRDSSVVVVGMPTWKDFQSLDYSMLQKLNYYSFASSYVDFTDPSEKTFAKKFRLIYKNEPSTSAYEGFEFSMFYLKMLAVYGGKLNSKLTTNAAGKINPKFEFRKAASDGGYENQNIVIFKIEDYSLKICNR